MDLKNKSLTEIDFEIFIINEKYNKENVSFKIQYAGKHIKMLENW